MFFIKGTRYAGSASMLITWDAPATLADGTSAVDIAGYRISWGIETGVYTGTVDVGVTLSTTVSNIVAGPWLVVVQTLDSSGNASEYSLEKQFTAA